MFRLLIILFMIAAPASAITITADSFSITDKGGTAVKSYPVGTTGTFDHTIAATNTTGMALRVWFQAICSGCADVVVKFKIGDSKFDVPIWGPGTAPAYQAGSSAVPVGTLAPDQTVSFVIRSQDPSGTQGQPMSFTGQLRVAPIPASGVLMLAVLSVLGWSARKRKTT